MSYRTSLYIVAVIATCAPATASTVSSGQVDESGRFWSSWSRVGSQPCEKDGVQRCDVATSLAQAAQHGQLTRAVQDEALNRFTAAYAAIEAGEEPDWETFQICTGWKGWVSYYSTEQFLVSRALATFAECEVAYGWQIRDPDTGELHRVFRVEACGNYAGDKGLELGYYTLEHQIPGTTQSSSTGTFTASGAAYGGGSGGGGGISFNGGGTCSVCFTDSEEDGEPGNGFTPPDNGDTVAPIPLPAAAWLLLLALSSLGVMSRRKLRSA